MIPYLLPPRSSLLALTFLCVLMVVGYLTIGLSRFGVPPDQGFGLKADYLPATGSFKVIDIAEGSPASYAGLHKDELITAINDRSPLGRFAFDWLAWNGAPAGDVNLQMTAPDYSPPRTAIVTLRFAFPKWFFSLIAMGSLLCGLVFFLLNQCYPAPQENVGRAMGAVVLTAQFPMFVPMVLWRSISPLIYLPLWALLLVGLPSCIVPLFLVPKLGIGFDPEAPSWRTGLLIVGMLLPLPFLIAIHVSHRLSKGVDPRDFITDVGLDYLTALGVLLLLTGLFVSLRWFFRSKSGYRILPFVHATDDEFNGQLIAEELAAALQRIDDAHQILDRLYQRYVLYDEYDQDRRVSPRSRRHPLG